MSGVTQSTVLDHHERLWPLIVTSAAIHALFILVAALYRPAPPVDLNQKPIVAKLVRLGEKRPENWLPREEAAPPPAPKPPEPVPTPPPEAKPEPAPPVPKPAPAPAPVPAPPKPAPTPTKPTPAAKKPPKEDVVASVLNRVKRESLKPEKVYGDPKGHAQGDSNDGAGDQYLALVISALRDSYNLPLTLSDSERVRLSATLSLYIDANGRIVRHVFRTRSGNAAVDAALERAIRSTRLPPPPPEFQKEYRTEGLGVVYRP